MFGPIVLEVAALTQRGEIARAIVARVMVEVCAGKDDASYPVRVGNVPRLDQP